MSRALWSLGFVCLVVAIAARSDGAAAGPEPGGPQEGRQVVVSGTLGGTHVHIIRIAQKKPRKKAAKKGAPTDASPDTAAAKPAETADGGDLKFSRDIAPIFVGNCIGCHNEKGMTKNGKLDLTTFEKLQKGGKDGAIVVAGKPDESHLYLRLTGDETPKMPRGAGNRPLSVAAIERVGDWIKAGGRLDAGIDPKALLTSYAPSAAQTRQNELAKLPVAERHALVEAKGLERFKKGSPKAKPEVTSSKSFMLFGNLPRDRISATTKALETQYSQLRSLLTPDSKGDPVMKVGVYIFNDRASFVEFIRGYESRDVASAEVSTANMADAEPYVAVLDPLGGGEAPASSPKKSARSRKSAEADAGAPRSLAGVIVEALAAGEVKREGEKAPLWLGLGLGAYFASRVDARAQSTQQLRNVAFEQFAYGWNNRASDALGGEAKPDTIRAVGFAVVDALQSTPQTRPYLPAFVRIMLRGQEKMDDALQNVLGLNREQFLEVTGQFVGSRYGRAR